MIKSITSVKVSGRRVILRVGFDVPLTKNIHTEEWEVADDTRIRDILPTLRYLIDQGSRIVIMSHLGRPQGWEAEKSLWPAALKLGELINYKTVKRPDGTEVKTQSILITLSEKEKFETLDLLDSGADISAMPLSLAEILGLEMPKEIHSAYGIGGKVEAVETKMTITAEKGHEKYTFRIPIKIILGNSDKSFNYLKKCQIPKNVKMGKLISSSRARTIPYNDKLTNWKEQLKSYIQ